MADQVTGFFSPWLRKKRLKAIQPYLNQRILDFGCGTGELAEFCQPDKYIGYDIDDESISLARKHHTQYRFETHLPQEETFDTIVMLAVIEHISNPVDLFLQLKQMLSTTGQIILTTPHPIGKQIYSLGAYLGLFSSEAHEEHEQFFNLKKIEACAKAAGMKIKCYKRFLGVFNQLIVLHTRDT